MLTWGFIPGIFFLNCPKVATMKLQHRLQKKKHILLKFRHRKDMGAMVPISHRGMTLGFTGFQRRAFTGWPLSVAPTSWL